MNFVSTFTFLTSLVVVTIAIPTQKEINSKVPIVSTYFDPNFMVLPYNEFYNPTYDYAIMNNPRQPRFEPRLEPGLEPEPRRWTVWPSSLQSQIDYLHEHVDNLEYNYKDQSRLYRRRYLQLKNSLTNFDRRINALEHNSDNIDINGNYPNYPHRPQKPQKPFTKVSFDELGRSTENSESDENDA